jgi:integrase/recombinase XerD
MRAEQLSLFGEGKGKEYILAPLVTPMLTKESSLASAIGGFQQHMASTGFAENTQKAFLGDLRLLSRYVGLTKPVWEIGTQELVDFLAYLRYYRGVPCTSKSYARRVTTLKSFFKWLAEEGVIPSDPAAALIHEPASSPLPQILYDAQVESLLAATRALLERSEKPDARPHLLVTLLLSTGLKKSECMAIRLSHIDISPSPTLYVRQEQPRKRLKERKLRLPPDFPKTLALYREQYAPRERLFECTARNLEYVLHQVAEEAGIEDGLSFEALRMTSAVRDYRAGMPPDLLREKLGLSKVTWREKEKQIKTLAGPAL